VALALLTTESDPSQLVIIRRKRFAVCLFKGLGRKSRHVAFDKKKLPVAGGDSPTNSNCTC
jgi:hypothetical protein